MSGVRFEVPGLSRAIIESRANLIRTQYKVVTGKDPENFPILQYIELILARVLPDFLIESVEPDEIGGVEAFTRPDTRSMCIRRDVYDGARSGVERDRFTVAHELGHQILHAGIAFARAAKPTEELPAYCCSEWQANFFAGAVLMPTHIIKPMASITEVAEKCGVSFQAADVRLKKLGLKKPQF